MTDLERLEELLVDEATAGLSPAGQEELDRLLTAHPDVDRYAFQRAVAIAFVATASPVPEMPESLRTRILAASAGDSGR